MKANLAGAKEKTGHKGGFSFIVGGNVRYRELESLRNMIARGEYQIDPDKIADGIITRESMSDG